MQVPNIARYELYYLYRLPIIRLLPWIDAYITDVI